ncbi:MAG: hypothetical protein AAGE13_05915 [Pseudomonadota bacterium]
MSGASKTDEKTDGFAERIKKNAIVVIVSICASVATTTAGIVYYGTTLLAETDKNTALQAQAEELGEAHDLALATERSAIAALEEKLAELRDGMVPHDPIRGPGRFLEKQFATGTRLGDLDTNLNLVHVLDSPLQVSSAVSTASVYRLTASTAFRLLTEPDFDPASVADETENELLWVLGAPVRITNHTRIVRHVPHLLIGRIPVDELGLDDGVTPLMQVVALNETRLSALYDTLRISSQPRDIRMLPGGLIVHSKAKLRDVFIGDDDRPKHIILHDLAVYYFSKVDGVDHLYSVRAVFMSHKSDFTEGSAYQAVRDQLEKMVFVPAIEGVDTGGGA